MTDLAARIALVRRPAPRPATVTSYAVLAGMAALGVYSIATLGFSWELMSRSIAKVGPFLERATPLVWPGYKWDNQALQVVWVGWGDVAEFFGIVAVTLGIVICGTFLAAVLSVPVAYLAARNTTPHPVAMVVGRGIGVVARAIPDVAFASIFVFLFLFGPLPGVLAIMLHSVGMISKMFADAIEQIDEGPRLAIRSTGGSRAQEFWSGVVPQVFPAWVAVALHRADINLRGTVILGYVGVAGLGYELSTAFHALNYRRAIPIAIAIVVLCVLFEVVSSSIRARLLGVRPTGRGLGDAIVRGAAQRSAAVAAAVESGAAHTGPTDAVEAAMRRPWTRERIGATVAIWVAVLVVGGSFFYSGTDWTNLGAPASQVPILLKLHSFWPPTFGINKAEDVFGSILVTLQVAFAATLAAAVVVCLLGTLAARNVAPNGFVRNTFRGILLVVRGMPELILAILFVIITGLGPQAGTLALTIGGVGLMGKLIADSLEEVPSGPERAVRAVGGTRPQQFFASTLPMSVPAFVGHLVYLFEQNVRAATLLGIVGGGGIGYYLYDSLRVSKYDQVIAILLIIIALVLVIEGAAVLLRRALR